MNNDDNVLRIGLLNCSGLKNNISMIQQNTEHLGIDIIGLTETWLQHELDVPQNVVAATIQEKNICLMKNCFAGVATLKISDAQLNTLYIDHQRSLYNIVDIANITIIFIYLLPVILCLLVLQPLVLS